ncbi:MAG: PIN domain-containing protein [Nanoarchaeota archaeon]
MVCLETTFIIDFLKGKNEAKLKMQEIEVRNEVKLVASPSIVELIAGTRYGKNIKSEKNSIIAFLDSVITLPLDKKSAILAGEIEIDFEDKGSIIDIEEVMIGAIAIQNNEPLLTRNIKHFERIKDLKIQAY